MYTDKHSGKKYTQQQIDRNLSKAKKELRQEQIDEYGYQFCVSCGINSSHSIIDCSHVKSVKWCKEHSEIELIWDKSNMDLLCREEHQKRDGLTLQF